MHGRHGILCVVASLALGTALAQEPKAQRPAPAKEPASPSPTESAPDAQLLEFLGSFDEEDGDWIDYLTVTEVTPPPQSRSAQPAPEVKKDE